MAVARRDPGDQVFQNVLRSARRRNNQRSAFGAHLDMAESWAGEKNVSTCTMARITELPNLSGENVAIVGVRNSMNPKDYIDLAKSRGVRFYPMFDIVERGIDAVAGDRRCRPA